MQTHRLAGKSLAELAQAQGVRGDARSATFLDEHTVKLVTAGKLARALAAAMCSRMQEHRSSC
jgi:hypothetical protein